ncbi:MAG: hypothetical protein BWX88_05293 [Planctomycetes bacterium ADurb.Bin126]|nr:MAG: hypothetical protein BWX88_05293 [Planctomycetes bacterium ADurb.Bin126]
MGAAPAAAGKFQGPRVTEHSSALPKPQNIDPTTLMGTTTEPLQVVVVPLVEVYFILIVIVTDGDPVAAIFARPKTAASEMVTFPVTVTPGSTVTSSNSN